MHTPPDDLISPAERLAEVERLHSRDPQAAMELAEQMESEAARSGDIASRAVAVCLQAVCQQAIGNREEAFVLAQRAHGLAESAGALWWQGRALNIIGIEYKLGGQHDAALSTFWDGLRLARQICSTKLETKILSNMATAYVKIGRYGDAMEQAQRALKLQEEEGDEYGAGYTQNVIGQIYQETGRWRDSVTAFRRGLQLFERAGSRRGEVYALITLGYSLCTLGELEEAEAALNTGLAWSREMELVDEEANALGNLAKIYVRRKEYDTALEHYGQCRAIFERLRRNDALAEASLDMGVLYAEHEPERALVYLHEAANLSERESLPAMASRAHNELYILYKRRGAFADALRHYERFHDLERKLFSEESDKRLQKLEVKYALEKANKDAEIARIRSTELAEALAEAETLRHAAEELAKRDVLTGLYNRRYLNEWLSAYFETAQAAPPLTILLLDIDNFKPVNDDFSHRIGDRVLQVLAEILQQHCADGEIVARYGGEEFVVTLRQSDTPVAARCERIRRDVAAHDWNTLAEGLKITISGGVCDSGVYLNFEKMLDVADANLYKAKNGGRNRICA